MPESTKRNVYQRLLAITEAVGKIEKTGTNESQHYKYIEQGLVVAEIRVQMVKHGVMIIPETVSRTMERYVKVTAGYKAGDPPKEQSTFHANVVSRYTIINADDPTDRLVCEWDAGEALDTSDKATNKATTASDKSFLMKLFKISDKADPDAESPTVSEAKKTPKVSNTPPLKVKEAPQYQGDQLVPFGGDKFDPIPAIAAMLQGIKAKLPEIEKVQAINIVNNLAKQVNPGVTAAKDLNEVGLKELDKLLMGTRVPALEMLVEA